MWAASAARRFFRAAPSWARHGSVIAAASLAVTCADRLHFTTEAEKPAEYVHDTVSVTEPIRPPTRKDIADRSKKIKIFGGRHNAELAEQIASYIGVPRSHVETTNFADGESSVKIVDPIEQGEVFVVQSTGPPVNENVMELLLIISTLRRSAARRITAVIPYFGYKRDTSPFGEASTPGSPFVGDTVVSMSAADIAKMLETMGVDSVISVDLQPPGYGQIEGFFDNTVRVDNLRPYSVAIKYLTGPKVRLEDPVVVAANETCVEMAKDFKSGMEKRLHVAVPMAALVQGEDALVAARHPPTAGYHAFNLSLVGDVRGRDCVIVDDLLDTADMLTESVRVLKNAGARKIVLYATHNLLTKDGIKIIQACEGLTEVVVTNTIPLGNKLDNASCSKISQISIAPLLAEAVLRVIEQGSLQDLRVFDRENIHERYAGQGKE